jgi:membrane protease YdiL (CAAX protease family)
MPAGGYFALVALLYTWLGSQAQAWHLPLGLWWSQILLFCIPTFLWLRSAGYRPLRFLRLTKGPQSSRGTYLAVAVSVFLCASALNVILQSIAPQSLAERFDEGRLLASVGGGWRGVLFAAVILGAPLSEEIVFRGYLLPALAGRFGIVRAVVGQALLFSLIHLDPIGFAPRLLLGLVFGWLVILSGSLWSSIAAHALNNGLSTLLFFIGGEEGATPTSPVSSSIWIAANVAAGSGIVLWTLHKRLQRRTPALPPLPQDDPATRRTRPPTGAGLWWLWAMAVGMGLLGLKLFADRFGAVGAG